MNDVAYQYIHFSYVIYESLMKAESITTIATVLWK